MILIIGGWMINLQAGNIVRIGSQSGNPGDTVRIEMDLINTDTIAGIQLDVSYDAARLIPLASEPTSRSFGFSSASSTHNNILHMVLYSMTGGAITPGRGTIAAIPFIIRPESEPGDTLLLECGTLWISDRSGNRLTSEAHNGYVAIKPSTPPTINHLTLLEDSASIHDTVRLAINLKNQDHIAGLQLDLIFDPSVLCYQRTVLGSRPAGFTCIDKINANQLTIMIYSISGQVIPPDSGMIIEIEWVISAQAKENTDYPVQFQAALLSGSQGNALPVTWSHGFIYIRPNVDLNESIQLTNLNPTLQNYPNPFPSSTILEYTLSRTEIVSLGIYDISGRLIQNLIDRRQVNPGIHQCVWTGNDRDGKNLPSGLYLAILKLSSDKVTHKLMKIQ